MLEFLEVVYFQKWLSQEEILEMRVSQVHWEYEPVFKANVLCVWVCVKKKDKEREIACAKSNKADFRVMKFKWEGRWICLLFISGLFWSFRVLRLEARPDSPSV